MRKVMEVAQKEKMVKVMVYMSEREHHRLKARLALLGRTVSGWVREKTKVFLNSSDSSSSFSSSDSSLE